MYFWYAYRMEVQAFGPGTAGRTIARDCVGTVPDKTCYFDEFLKHISWEPWNGKTVRSFEFRLCLRWDSH